MAVVQPTLDVVVPALNEGQNIERCVTAIQRAFTVAGIPEGRVVVVDDGSSDETSAIAIAAGADVIRHHVSQGPRLAWHAGIGATSAPWILLTDADCHLDEQAIARLAPYFADESVGILAGRSVSLHQARTAVGRSARFSTRLLHETKLRLDDHDFQPIGRLMVLRRSSWLLADPLMGPCDRAVACEAHAAGYSIRYVPEAVVYYELVASYAELAKDFRRTVLSRTVHPEEFQALPRSVLMRSAVASALHTPLDAACWATMRLLILSERRHRARDEYEDLLLRWNPYGRDNKANANDQSAVADPGTTLSKGPQTATVSRSVDCSNE